MGKRHGGVPVLQQTTPAVVQPAAPKQGTQRSLQPAAQGVQTDTAAAAGTTAPSLLQNGNFSHFTLTPVVKNQAGTAASATTPKVNTAATPAPANNAVANNGQVSNPPYAGTFMDNGKSDVRWNKPAAKPAATTPKLSGDEVSQGITSVMHGWKPKQPSDSYSENLFPEDDKKEDTASKKKSAPALPKSVESYAQFIDALNAYGKAMEPDEETKKRRKRDALFSSITDGLSALANLYYTTKGAPNAFSPKGSLSERAAARWDRADRKLQQTAGNRLKLAQLRYNIDAAREAAAAKAADAKADRELKGRALQSLMDFRAGTLENGRTRAKAAQTTAEANKAAKEARTQNDNDKTQAIVGYYGAKAGEAKDKGKAALIKAEGSGKGSSSSGKGSSEGKVVGSIFGPDGQWHRYRNKADYETSAVSMAKRLGINIDDPFTGKQYPVSKIVALIHEKTTRRK